MHKENNWKIFDINFFRFPFSVSQAFIISYFTFFSPRYFLILFQTEARRHRKKLKEKEETEVNNKKNIIRENKKYNLKRKSKNAKGIKSHKKERNHYLFTQINFYYIQLFLS